MGLAGNTVAQHVKAIKGFCRFLVGEGCLEADPSARIPIPRVGRRLPRALSKQEIRRLFRAMEGETRIDRRNKALFHLLFIQDLLGHESLATTGVYTQLADEMMRDVTLNVPTAIEAVEEDRVLKEREAMYEAGCVVGELWVWRVVRNQSLSPNAFLRPFGRAAHLYSAAAASVNRFVAQQNRTRG